MSPLVLLLAVTLTAPQPDFTTEIRQATFGPKHHFFGYIGHVQTIPWNKSGRYILALESAFQDRMPKASDAATILLLDTRNHFAPRAVESTRAWNFQQGTMLYWNPEAPETQFFFNDRDPRTNEVFAVLYDIEKQKRIAEYRFTDAAIGNSGVAQRGGWFAAINYGRLARLRPVTGYPEASDWTKGKDRHPADDGVFKVNVKTKEKQLLVSFKQLADVLRPSRPDVDAKELFINHTLWSRDDRRLFFFVRGDFEPGGPNRIDVPFTIQADGTDLRPLGRHIGGHPEWASGSVMIGLEGNDQILFDVDKREVVGKLGSPQIFPKPGGDIALSPDGEWLINGHGSGGKNYYTILRRRDGAWTRTVGLDQGGFTRGELRIDPAPSWNRESNQFLAVGIDEKRARQIFIVTIKTR